MGGDPSLRFDYDPGANYGLNISAEISQTTIMTTLRGAEQGNKGERGRRRMRPASRPSVP